MRRLRALANESGRDLRSKSHEKCNLKSHD